MLSYPTCQALWVHLVLLGQMCKQAQRAYTFVFPGLCGYR